MSRLTMLAMAVALVFAAAPAHAVPQVLQYQGRLTDAAGEPLAGAVTLTFSIYDETEGGEALWSQVFEELTPDNGRFSVLLGGEEAPFTAELVEQLREGADLFLGIQVDEDPEMSPRQQIASVAYGLHAGSADSSAYAEESGHAATADEVEGLPGIAWQAAHRAAVGAGEAVSAVSVEITTPVDGYVLVSASGTLVLDNRARTGVLVHANIGEEQDGIPEADMGLTIASVDDSAAAALHYVPFHSQRVYPMTAGSHTFHLNVSVRSATGTAAANRPSITALFFPRSYGAGGDGEVRSSNQRR